MGIRNVMGYAIGFILFIVLIPALMWWASGQVAFAVGKMICFALFAAAGIALSIWSIVHMKIAGKGNPLDAFNHEIAPRTSNLMTDGPYRICRNPMLLGVLIYYIGVLIYLHTWQALVIFAIYVLIMMVQVHKEEKRLEQDFGEEYRAYKKRTKKLIPFVW